MGDREVGVVGVIENGRKVIELCTEKRMCVGNSFFEKKDIHKFSWTIGVDDHISLLDFIVVQEEERNKLLYINVLRNVGGGILDHHLVIAKISMVSMEERYEIEVSELRKVTCETEYEDELNRRWERVRVKGGERKCVGQGKLGKGREEKGVNDGVRKLGE